MGFLEEFEQQTRPDVEKRPWMNDVTMELVTTATLDGVVDACIESKLYAMDVETTGMDNRVFNGRTRDKIVGVGLSPDGKRGYYIPIRHKKGEKHNLEPSVVVAALRRLVASEAVAIFHNAKFDTEFLQFSEREPLGMWDRVKEFEDTLILAWLRNTRERNKTLKHLSKVELEKEMIELDELFDAEDVKKRKGKLDFSELDPGWGPCLWYACSDVICTYQLFHVLHPQVITPKEKRIRSQKNIYNLEKLCVPATRWMERCRVWIDPEKVTELLQLGQQEFFDCVCDVYDFCNEALGRNIEPGWVRLLRETFVSDNPDYNINQQIDNCRTNARRKDMDELDAEGHYRKTSDGFPRQYDILSRQQLGPLFQELKIPDLRKTEKKKQVQTTQAEIERLNERYGHRYPFLPKIKRLGELQKALGTYLISLHNDVGPDGTLRVNYQQLGTDTGRFTTPASTNPALDGGTKYPMHGTPAIYQKKRPQCLLRIREAIKARPGKMLVACFAKGSLVSTARGLIPVEQVADGDRVLTETGYQTVNWAGYTGTKPTVTLKTSKGFELRTTPDHRVLVASEEGFDWKEAGNLIPGDWVVQVSGAAEGCSFRLPDIPWSEDALARSQEQRYPLRVPRSMTTTFAEFLGRFMGDGSLSHGRKGKLAAVNLALGADLDEVLPRVNKSAYELFGREFSSRGRGDVSIASRPLCRWLELVTGKGETDVRSLRVPDSVLMGDAATTAAFLRGLFDADGSVKKRPGDGVTLWASSTLMAQQVQLLLLQHGIQIKRVWAERETNYGHASGWEMTITGIRNLERFRDRIGMASYRKNLALDLLLLAGRNRDMSEFIPLGLAKKAVVRQRYAETNRIHTNGRRKGRVSRALLQAALLCPEDVDGEWMELLLDGPLMFDTVECVSESEPIEVFDVSVPEGHRLQVGGILAHNCDFGGVELRIATILSGEPKWLKEFFRCSTCGQEFERGDGKSTPIAPPAYCPKCGDDRIGDLHTLTAITFFGEDKIGTKQWKQMRNQAKCVHPDTLVFSDEGLCRIGKHYSFGAPDEFRSNNGRLWNGREFQAVRAAYNGGKKRLFHVVTHRGIVTCSDQHRFKMANGRLLSIKDGLAKGMALQLPDTPPLRSTKKWPVLKYRGKDDLPEVAIHTNSGLAYLCGLYVGDGTKSGNRSVSITHGSVAKTDRTGLPYSEWQDEIVELTEGLGFRPVRQKMAVYLGSRGVMTYLGALGLISPQNERLLRIPDWILKAGREASLFFLGGLIDADGTVGKKDAEPSITTKDGVFAGQLMALLRALGFVPRAEACWNKTYRRWYYRLHLRASEAPRLRKYMRHRGKRDRIRKAGAPDRQIKNEVREIVPAGTQACVDVSMKGRARLYWCNGLITHNSGNFAMVYGGGPSALLRSIDGCTEEEATRHHRGFTSTYSTLKAWWDEIKAFGRENGYVMTAFGRHYPIPDIQLPTSGRGVVKALQDKYKEKLAAGEKATPPTEEQIKKQVEWNRKFRAKAERNATNGPIQGLSADLTKLAMAMIYRECKKRNWLEKVYMVITIHDELVFEIDYDIAAEAIELFQEIMTRNQTILDRKWPIPLTTDCEVGYDWTVPYDVKDFKYKRVRPDGLQVDEKGRLPRDKETGKLKAKLWPSEFVKTFGPVYGFAPIVENLTAEEGRELFGNDWQPLPLTTEATEPVAPLKSSESATHPTAAPSMLTAPAVPEMPRLERGEVFVYRLRTLGVGVADKLARVIVECQGRGSYPLRVISPMGEDVLWEGASIMVNPHEFRTAANYHGI